MSSAWSAWSRFGCSTVGICGSYVGTDVVFDGMWWDLPFVAVVVVLEIEVVVLEVVVVVLWL